MALLMAMLAIHSVRGQTIAKPTVYTSLASGPQTVTGTSISGSDGWFRWTCGDGIAKLNAKVTEQGTAYQCHMAEFYTVQSADSIQRVFVDSLNSDSTFLLVAGYLNAGDTLFIRFLNVSGSCASCTYANPLINFTIYSTTANCSPSVPCGMVRNGGFEQNSMSTCGGYDITDGVDCWYPYENSTDVYRRGCIPNSHNENNLGISTGTSPILNAHSPSPNNTIIGQICSLNPSNLPYRGYNESVQSLLATPLLPGHTYSLSCWLYSYSGPFMSGSSNPMGHPVIMTFGSSAGFISSPSSNPILYASYPLSSSINQLTSFTVTPLNTWTQYSATFTYNGPVNSNLLVGPNMFFNEVNGNVNHTDNLLLYVAIDDIEIIETTPLTTTSTTICAGQTGTISASGMISYNWQPGNTTGASIPVNPIATTVYTVTGMNGGGCPQVKTATVTVNPLPSISLNTYSAGICPGGNVTLSATGAVSYTWSPCGPPSNCNTNALVVSPSSNTTYTVTGLAWGCTNTATASVYILNPNNSIQVSGYSIICQGESAYFSATGATNYTWSPCASGCNSATFAPSPSVTTTYTVRGINACGVLSTTTVTVNVKPTYPVDPAVLSNPVCAGKSVSLIANGGSPYSYTWTPGNTVGTMISVTPSVTTSYTACTAVLGCTTVCAAVTVTVMPVPQLTVTPASFTVCAGTPTTITVAGASSYTWDPCGSGCNGSAFTVTSYTDPSVYTVTGTAANSCTSSAQAVATVIAPGNNLNVSTSSATICAGNGVTLSASGSSSYTWAPCALGCNSSSISVSPTVTTTYTVYGLNNCGNVISKTVQVVVRPPYVITANAQPNAICAGSSSTLSAGSAGNITYLWFPVNAVGPSVVVSPTVTTTYTVQSIVPNCGLVQALVTVSVNAMPISANLSPSANFVCAGSSVVLNANVTPAGNYTYNWLPSGAQTASPGYTFTPTENETYFFTVSNACGAVMSNVVCIDVVNNQCCQSIENMPGNLTIGNSSPFTNMDPSTHSPRWRVNGPVTITGNVTWRNMDYHMMQGAKITIVPGAKLTLQNCRLFSCSDLWEGIVLQGGGPPATPKIELTGTTIEDAYRAIYYDAQNGAWDDNIVTSGSTFNKNYIGINITNTSATPVSISTAVAMADRFTGAASATSPGNKLKCSSFYSPVIKNIPLAGVYFDNQNCDLHLGDAGFHAANSNTYDNLNYGIYLNNAMTRVFKSSFSNLSGPGLTGFPAPPPVGIGVYAVNSYTSVNHSVHVEQCSFARVYRGVHTEGINRYTVLNSQFNAPLTDLNYTGNMAVYANNTVDNGMVQNSSIGNFATGVYHGYSAPAAAPGFSLSVFQNTITAAGTATAYCNQAITLNDAVNTLNAPGRILTISTNQVSVARNGIAVTNVQSGLRISNNSLAMPYSASGTYAGIKLSGSQQTLVDNNTISSSGTGNVNLRGIYLQLSPSCYVKCNTVSNVGQGFVIEGNCLTNTAGFVNNTVNTAYDGLVLKLNGVIGPQGNTAGSAFLRYSSGNAWLGSFTNSKTLVMDFGSSAINSKLQVRNNANENPAPQTLNKVTGSANSGIDNFGTSTFNSTASLIINAYANQVCPAPSTTGYRTATTDTSGQAYLKALGDSALYNLLQGPGNDALIEQETRELSRAYVYNQMANGYKTAHAGLNAFYRQQGDSALSVYSGVDSLILSGDYTAAQQQNGSSVSTTPIQQNQQLINSALLKQATGSGSFTSGELADLTQLANQCPLIGGTSVYQARALLCALFRDQLIFTENCEVDNKSRKAKTSVLEEEQISLYPNPNKGAMTLHYAIYNHADLIIYDISGRIMYKQVLSKDANRTDLQTNLAEGIYIYSIITERGRVLKTDKLVIIQ